MKLFNENFELLFFVLLCSVIPYKSISQSIGKMPDNNWWTLSNLNLDIPGSYCYNDAIMNCQKYGRLYTWEAAQNGCSLLGEGWHLPSTAEWNNLLKHFAGAFEESISNGKNAFEELLRTEKPTFGATLGGNRNTDGTYSRIEAHGFTGPLQYLMIVVLDSSILQMAERCFFYNLTWKKTARFLCDVLRTPNNFN